MRNTLLIILLLLMSTKQLFAQTETTSFNVNGIKVIFKPTQKNIINVCIFYRGGVTNYPASKAGIEDLALTATLQCGTTKYTANAFRDTADKYGIIMSGHSTYDYGFIQLNCISKYFNQGWDLFTEAVNNPVFNDQEVELLKKKAITAVNDRSSSPDNRLLNLQMRSAFANTAYKFDPAGTEETIKNIGSDDFKKHYNTLLNKNKIFIVVVGNVGKQALFEKIVASFDNMVDRPYTSPELTTPAISGDRITTEEQPLRTNYVSAVMNAPEFTSADFVPFRLAISGLAGNLYASLRTSQHLSYDPGAGTYMLRMPFAYMRASSTEPQQVMFGMMNVLKRIQQNGYDEEWLQHIKNSYITTSYVNDQNAAQITMNLGLAEVLGNWHYADDLPQLVKMVTVEQMDRVINLYVTGLRWNYIGGLESISGLKVPPY